MNILICLRQGRDGEINPFDAAAYEAALRLPGADIILLSMGIPKTADLLLRLTRLGAKRAILLTDPAFAGADTLATAYTLSLAVKKLDPDLIFCGRQTLEGDTGQVGPMLSVLTDRSLITNVMGMEFAEGKLVCDTRADGIVTAECPALLTVERIHTLRLPSIRSKPGTVETWSAADIGADMTKTGLKGSPTRVLKSEENAGGRRKCTFITAAELPAVVAAAKDKAAEKQQMPVSEKKLQKVLIVGESPRAFAETVADNIEVLPPDTVDALCTAIQAADPDAVLWGTDPWSKRTASLVCAKMGLGLCADCTALSADGDTLLMIRPALSGTVIATIKSLTRPAMATVRTTEDTAAAIMVAAGLGVKTQVEKVKTFAENLGAELVATRRMVDEGVLPYACQVGLTGRTVAPPVYIAVGVSGAVHHIVGMQQAGTVIAVNPDKKAPIFDYADFGIVAEFEEI